MTFLAKRGVHVTPAQQWSISQRIVLSCLLYLVVAATFGTPLLIRGCTASECTPCQAWFLLLVDESFACRINVEQPVCRYYHLEPLLNEKKFERSSDVARKRRAKKEINAEWGTVSPHLHFDVRALNWCFWCQKHVVTVYVETTPPAPHRGKWRAGTRRDNHRPDNASRGKRDIPDINDIFFKVRQTLLSLVCFC